MNSARVKIQRLRTGVPGLDEVLGGGLPEFSFNLLAGLPGSGKTTLAHQMMFAMATPERPALYFTVIGEPPLKMLRYQQQFNFFDSERVGESIHFISLADEIASGSLDAVLRKMVAEVQARSPGLVFVDSFRSLVLSGGEEAAGFLSLQQFIQSLGTLMSTWQATTFLLGEYAAEHEQNPVFTVADGLIWLRQSVYRNSIVRQMEVMKMRGQPTQPGLHTFRITEAGIHVFAPALASAHARGDATPLRGPRLKMGIAGLDEMMGGGLPHGFSVLVAGPSGSGKSILAAAFLAEGAREGQTGVLAAFEQRPNRSRGAAMTALIESGQVGVVDTRAVALSVDEISTLLLAEIRRIGATRVVIDSMSGFELALAPAFREDFREAAARMVALLVGTGVTVLMTSELEDRYSDLRFSPYGTAFLTDAIIVQRYIEVESRLRRVLAVVKVRASAHSDELRLFHIDDDGIHIGGMLAETEGLLGGQPTRRKRVAVRPDG